MSRRPKPAGVNGTSGYLGAGSDGRQVMLWAFGVAFGSTHGPGLFFGRFEFVARWLPSFSQVTEDWDPEALQRLPGPPCDAGVYVRDALISGCEWMANYEQWVLTHMGEDYRAEVILGSKLSGVSASALGEAWRGLAVQTSRWAP
jgi:hypothetical protein